MHTPVPGKRNAVKIGTELSRGEITVLVDSDTVWTDGTLPELVKPFADASVGGVTTRQRILDPERSWITRWADWLENTRALYSMPAQSRARPGGLPARAAPSRSAGTSSSRSWTTSCTRSSSASSSRSPTTAR